MPSTLVTMDAEGELSGLIDYIQTGLLSAALRKRVGHFPEVELKMAVRDLLDWMSLRCILRGRTASLGGNVHPLAGRIVARLEALSRYLCVPDHCLGFRVEVPVKVQWELENLVNRRIWRRQGAGVRTAPERIFPLALDAAL